MSESSQDGEDWSGVGVLPGLGRTRVVSESFLDSEGRDCSEV